MCLAPLTTRGLRRYLDLARNRNVWGIVLGRALTDPIWWFYVFWLPQYLSDARGFSLKRIALFAWMPFIAADIGNFTGGFISGYLVRRGISVLRARTWVCAVSCLPILAGIPAARVRQCFACAGAHLHCLVGICQLVHHGLNAAFRPASPRCSGHRNWNEWIGRGPGKHRFYLRRGHPGGLIFLHARVPGCGPYAACRHHLCVCPDTATRQSRQPWE